MSVSRLTRAPARRLPRQPSLEQLRKQAKDLLESYRSGVPAAGAEVNRFASHRNDVPFALSDAQRVIARAYGFASWPKLKAFVDGVTVARFAEAVQSGDLAHVRSMLASRPELVAMDRAANDEHRALHYAVLRRDPAMVRLLMEAGADARQGIFPHRDATFALALARDREYREIVAVMEEEERRRREEMSCPNATISPVQDQINAAISHGDEAAAIHLLEDDRTLIQACDREGATPLHVAARESRVALVAWLLERRANVCKRDVSGLTPFDHAALAFDSRHDPAQRFPRVAAMLLQHGAELTVRAAIAMGEGLRVRQLIEAEPGLLRQISSHGGLLTLAVKHRQLAMAQLLIDLGADVDERILLEELEEPAESWGMPLWNAALIGDLALTRLLLDRGADPNANVYASGWPLRRRGSETFEGFAWRGPGARVGLVCGRSWMSRDRRPCAAPSRLACPGSSLALGSHSADPWRECRYLAERGTFQKYGATAPAWRRSQRLTLRSDGASLCSGAPKRAIGRRPGAVCRDVDRSWRQTQSAG